MALIETNFIRPQEVYDRNTGESKVRYRSYDGNDRFIPVVDGEKGVPKTMVEVTHAELKAMRDGGKLTPGALYRITDYNCTTTQENTQSAGHQFDIVLLALSENKLAEEGWAMMHENDTYFANSNLSAWKVWYCLDNDKSRFAWADDSVGGKVISINTFYLRNKTADNGGYYGWSSPEKTIYTTSETPQIGDTVYKLGKGGLVSDGTVESIQTDGTGLPNGRGVIYRLIDEWNNDVAYDFKNIQFKRKLTDGQYDATNGTETWVYTFNYVDSSGMIADSSMIYDLDNGYVTNDNKILTSDIDLPNTVFLETTSANSNIVASNNCTMSGGNVTLYGCFDCDISNTGIFLNCHDTFTGDYGVYISGKKVLTEE